uniref:Uncharacterized protein n=1 Tax=Magallana gigas TaxID=29159 RepID=K1QFC0_MAGGI
MHYFKELWRKHRFKSPFSSKTRVWYKRTKHPVANLKQIKLMIDVKAVKDDEIRLKRCEENYSRIDLMHRFIMQKLEMLEKLIEGEGDKHAVEQ